MPPDEKLVGIGRPGWLLWTVEGLEFLKQLGYGDNRFAHEIHRGPGER